MSDRQPLEHDPRGILANNETGAVLLSNEIAYYVTVGGMIENFAREFLEPASYNLRLGAEYRVAGKTRRLDGKNHHLTIQPYEVVVLSTYEKLCLPRFIIGRWSLRVTRAYEGLLWTGGAQVDPGYQGRLYCPVYNLSDSAFEIEYMDKIFSIDFVRTTPFDAEKCKKWEIKRADCIEAYDKHRLQSQLVETAKRAEDASGQIRNMQSITFVVLSIIIAAIAVVASVAIFGRFHVAHWWGWASFGLSILGVFLGSLALLAVFMGRGKGKT